MAFGTFDIFHKGHQSYLSQAKKLGDFLIVVVARDKTVKEFKKQETSNKEQERLRILKSCKLTGNVILGNLKDKYAVIKKYRPDIIALGYDQKINLKELKNRLINFNLKPKIVRLKPFKPEKYKSSKLRRGHEKKRDIRG